MVSYRMAEKDHSPAEQRAAALYAYGVDMPDEYYNRPWALGGTAEVYGDHIEMAIAEPPHVDPKAWERPRRSVYHHPIVSHHLNHTSGEQWTLKANGDDIPSYRGHGIAHSITDEIQQFVKQDPRLTPKAHRQISQALNSYYREA